MVLKKTAWIYMNDKNFILLQFAKKENTLTQMNREKKICAKRCKANSQTIWIICLPDGWTARIFMGMNEHALI